jgi:hypothetical protein
MHSSSSPSKLSALSPSLSLSITCLLFFLRQRASSGLFVWFVFMAGSQAATASRTRPMTWDGKRYKSFVTEMALSDLAISSSSNAWVVATLAACICVNYAARIAISQ